MLERLLSKHNLTIDDIEINKTKTRYYKYTTRANNDLIAQIIFSIISHKKVYENSSRKNISVEVSDYEHVQILEAIDFHLENFDKERKQFIKDFTNAYISKHNLYGDQSNRDEEDDTPLTVEEKQALWRMSNIRDCLANETYRKKLE